MAESILTAERLREVVDYDPLTGIFTRKVRLAQRHQIGDRADFSINAGPMTGYRRLAVDSKRYLAHRCAWLFVHGEWPAEMLDHINGEKGENQIANLRKASAGMNVENQRRPRKDNRTSRFLGVYWQAANQKWRARITTKGKAIHIGLFVDEEAAHAAYVEAKRKLHEGCTI